MVSEVWYRVRLDAQAPAGRLGDTWHLEELFVTIQGQRQYLWRAVDQDGDVAEIGGLALIYGPHLAEALKEMVIVANRPQPCYYTLGVQSSYSRSASCGLATIDDGSTSYS